MNSLPRTKLCAVVVFFVVVAIAYTWPLVINLQSSSGGDAFVFAHTFWWYKKALLDFANPFYTNYIFYPEGVNLAFQSGTFGNFLLTLPITLVAGPTAGVNASYFLTYVLSALFVFLLAYRLTGDLAASLFAGCVYSFSPFHSTHGAGHLNISSIHCLPAGLYALYRMLADRSWKWVVITGLFGGLTLLTDQLQSILLCMTGMMVYVWCVWNQKEVRLTTVNITGRFLASAGVALVVASPYLIAVANFMHQGSSPLRRDIFAIGGANMFSGDLLGFVIPPSWHALFGRSVAGLHPGGDNSQLYIGYTLLAVMTVGIFKVQSEKKALRILLIVSVFFFALSLGTTLHIGGTWQWNNGSFYKLPFYYLTQLPLFAEIRTPGRFYIATLFCFALVGAYSLASLKIFIEERFTHRFFIAVSAGIFILMAIEYLPLRWLTERIPDSQILQQIRRSSGDYTILWLPLSRMSSFEKNGLESPVKAMYYQTIHEKPILNGMLTRVAGSSLVFNDVLLDRLVDLGSSDRILLGNKSELGLYERNLLCREAVSMRPQWQQLRARLNIHAVVIQAPYGRPEGASRHYIECLTGQSLAEEPQGQLVYQLM